MSTRIDAGSLLARLKAGEAVSPHEFDEVAALLADEASGHDRYTLIHILGRGGQTQRRGLVESYLDSPTDPLLARIALIALCDWWGLTADYLGRLESFARTVPWDVDQDVRQIALAIIGRYLRDHDEPRLFRTLLAIASDEAEWDLIREDAIRALAVATGSEQDQMPPASRREPVDSEWSRGALGGLPRRHTGLLGCGSGSGSSRAESACVTGGAKGDLVDSYQIGLLGGLSCLSPVGVRVERVLCWPISLVRSGGNGLLKRRPVVCAFSVASARHRRPGGLLAAGVPPGRTGAGGAG